MQLDVRKPEQVDEMVERTVKHFADLDILVNNAAAISSAARRPFAEWMERGHRDRVERELLLLARGGAV